jgi:hypothetical protein
MPVEDFGFEKILAEEHKHIVIDTSALFYNIRFGMTKRQRRDFNSAIRNPDIQKRLKVKRATLARSIDFNIILSILLMEPEFEILEGVRDEYPGAETYYARRACVSLIRNRLVADYNRSVNRLRRTLGRRAKSLEEVTKRLRKLEDDNGEFNGDLKPVDRRVIASFIYHAEKGEPSVLLTTDKAIIRVGSALVERLKPKLKRRCAFYTMLNTNRFKRAAVRNGRVVVLD